MSIFLRLVWLGAFFGVFLLYFLPAHALAQESPYIVAYDHYLEEPGNLEVEYFSTFGGSPEKTGLVPRGRWNG